MPLDFRWYCVGRYLTFTVSTSLSQARWVFRFVQLTVGEFLPYGDPPFMTALCAKQNHCIEVGLHFAGSRKYH